MFRKSWKFLQFLIAPCPTPKVEAHPLSAVRDFLFNIFAATLHIWDRSPTRNLRTLLAKSTRKYNIKMDLRELGREGMDWIALNQDRDKWRAFVTVVMELWFP